jgi:uncharacterized protein (DUF885 family)
MTAARDLADRYHQEWLRANPFAASAYGIPGYDALVPDDSVEGDRALRVSLAATRREATELIDTGELDPEDTVSVECVLAAIDRDLDGLDMAAVEYTVTPMPYFGPAAFLATAARSVLATPQAAEDYLSRLAAAAGWIDRRCERLAAGARSGRLPVAPLVQASLHWGAALLAEPVPAPLVAPTPPEGWDRAPAWRDERDRLGADVVVPALRRWLSALEALLPRCRPGEAAGLAHLPGGDADYARAVRIHTTTDLTAEALHAVGLEELARLEGRCEALGASIGLHGLDAVHAAMRQASASAEPARAMAAAVRALRRAEARADELFPPPLPAPCEVTPMPPVVAVSGAAPHYSPPRLDGSRPGTYWFNTQRPTAGTGWDVEGVAFHETVPGHHTQLSRMQLLGHLPDFQRQRSVTAFSEGWGLYAEQLAEEMGLYSGTEALLGALANALMRAARLVVDTGLHRFGWGRDEALAFFVAHVPMPEAFLANEIDRYIVWPGQALAYLTGKREILRLREEARNRLGDRFSLPDFHAAVLDHGSLPLPVLARCVDRWSAARAA